jgi:FKBP-type peptidyl-prolyl cis-trans isomerase
MRNALFLFILFCTAGAVTAQDTIVTEHGFRFIHRVQKGGVKAQPGNDVEVSVTTFIGDTLMASTWDAGGPRQITLFLKEELPERVPAIYDGILYMAEGDSATVLEPISEAVRPYIPAELQGETLIRYEFKLWNIITPEEAAKKQAAMEAKYAEVEKTMAKVTSDYREGKLKKKLDVKDSGIKLLIKEKGKGKQVGSGESVKVDYYGCLPDGTHFDNSFQRGEKLQFTTSAEEMIPGFDEGVQWLNHGAKAMLIIPAKLAYGEEGTPDGIIPPNSEIIFYIEVE